MPQVTVTKIVEGESTLVVRVEFAGDGQPDFVRYPLLLPSQLVPPRKDNATAFRILQLWYGLQAFDLSLGFSTINSTTIWTLAQGTDSHVDFRSFGGLMDYATTPPNDVDGALWVSTVGLTGIGQMGSLAISLAKTNAP